MSFKRFPWQKTVLNIDEGEVTVKKAAQIGFSVAGMVRALYVTGQLVNDVLYILPTAGLAGDFSQARLDPIVDLSPELKGMYETDKVGLKITKQKASLYIRGSVSKSGLVSVPISSAIIDEYDRCEINTYDLVQERLSGQLTKYLFSLSTPTLPEFGIDKQYAEGTMEQFFVKCPSCGKSINLKWPDNVEICGEHMGDPDCAKSYLKCDLCQAKLPHESKIDWLQNNEWVAQRPSIQGHRSFHVNQMYSTTVSPEELVRAYHKSLLSDKAAVEFNNQKLGESHVCDGARLTDKIINDVRVKDVIHGGERPKDSSKLICMGVDVGSFLDCWIGQYDYIHDPGHYPYENSVQTLLQTIRIPTTDDTCWTQLGNLMREWQIHYACVDFQPDTVNARRFCRKFKGHASMVKYRRGTVGKEIKEEKDEHGITSLTVDRTSFLDLALGRFHRELIRIPYRTPTVVTEHLKAPVRTYEDDEMGQPRPIYKSISDDHMAHAAVYCEIAHFRAYTKSSGRIIKPDEL